MDGDLFLDFPAKEGQPTVGTEELWLPINFEAFGQLEQMRADLAENLRPFFPVVEVEVEMWCSAARTDDMFRNR